MKASKKSSIQSDNVPSLLESVSSATKSRKSSSKSSSAATTPTRGNKTSKRASKENSELGTETTPKKPKKVPPPRPPKPTNIVLPTEVVLDPEDCHTFEHYRSLSLLDLLDLQWHLSKKYCGGCNVRKGSIHYCNFDCPVNTQLASFGRAYSALSYKRRGSRSHE